MPRGDGTGPIGNGPMTGRGAGLCAGYNTGGFANPQFRRGFGAGRGFAGVGRGFGGGGRGFGAGGRGRGFGRGYGQNDQGGYAPMYAPPAYYPAPEPEQEMDALKNQAEYLSGALEDIQKRIKELEKK